MNTDMLTVSVRYTEEDGRRLTEAIDPRERELADGDGAVRSLAAIIARAGAREALDQATGRAVPATMPEQRSYRIYRLIDAGLPIDKACSLVAGIFQVSEARAKRYVEIALGRYHVELAERVNAALHAVFDQGAKSITPMNGEWWVDVPDALVSRVREIVHDHEAPDITPLHQGSLWRFHADSLREVRAAI